MEYNTNRTKLLMPEYGRNIQQMVEYCKSLPSKEERNEVRGRGAGKRVESIDREKQNEIRIWPKKMQRYGYHDRSPSRK